MVDSVKRGYRSEVRELQAQQTRRRIVAAAAQLFVKPGFAATTVEDVANAAGVSRKTVFTSVGGKVELLSLALDWAVAGDDEPTSIGDRPEVRALLRLEDPAVLLTRWAHVVAEIDRRVADLFLAVEAAAPADPTALAVFEKSNSATLRSIAGW